MVSKTIKSTYSLDVETVRALETLAKRWKVSKSEVLRRAVRAAVAGEATREGRLLAAVDRLQISVRERRMDLECWNKDMNAERRAWPDRWSSSS